MWSKHSSRAWMRASRLPSQLYIFFPLLLGQSMALALRAGWSWPLFVIAQFFGLCIQLFIVYANDFADVQADELNTTFNLFSGGSRVLVDGDISRVTMLRAIWLMVGLNLFIAFVLSVACNRPLSLFFVGVALFLLWAYSYPPLKLSYRGGGETLQMIGVAVVLPLFGYYIQAGSITGFPWIVGLVLLPNHLGCAVSTSLPDYPSDLIAGKRTATVFLGSIRARGLVIVLNWLSIASLLANPELPLSSGLQIALFPIVVTALLSALSKTAEPGTKHLLYFVFLNVFGVISMVIGLSIYFLL